MTVGEIIKRALMQVGEDIEDVEEYRELFLMYLNDGYEIAVSQYLHPRKTFTLTLDKHGRATLPCGVVRVILAREHFDDGCGMEAPITLAGDGRSVCVHTVVPQKGKTVEALCEVRRDPLEGDNDEPQMPPEFHSALADYVCYRHLLNGNLAKQSRANAYQQAFYQAMGRMKPEGFGSVTRYRNLYAASDVHARNGW